MSNGEPEKREQIRVLVVEDEPGIAGFIRRGLLFEGFVVVMASDGHDALTHIRDNPPDVVVLDIMLPGVDGIEITRRIRQAEAAEHANAVPILMLTARDAVKDRVTGLEAGADDYLVKPFAFDELLARIRAVLRRSTNMPAHTPTFEMLHFEDVTLDLGSRTANRAGRQLQFTTKEFDLLTMFLRHPNQVLSRAQIMRRVWGDDFYGDSNVLEVFVGNLRRELESDGEPRILQTIRGAGYVARRNP